MPSNLHDSIKNRKIIMKKSLKYLPEIKQEELQKIVTAIHKSCKDIEKIILTNLFLGMVLKT